jgi:hypothetical protein
MKAMLSGNEYYAVGRLCITKKRFGQEGEWYEWLLVSPDGDLRYLQWEGSAWTLWEPYNPIDEPAAERLLEAFEGDEFPFDGGTGTADMAGKCAITSYEGAFPWRIALDEMVGYVRLTSAGDIYYAKVPEFGAPIWYRGRRLKQQEVLALFGQHYATKGLASRKVVSEGMQFLGICCLIAAIIAFVLLKMAPRMGVVVAEGDAPISVISSQGAWMGPYSMPASNRVYQLDLTTDLNSPGSWVAARLDPHAPANAYTGASQPLPVFVPAQFLPHAESTFRIAKAGWYYVRLSSSLEPADSSAQVHFSLRSGVLYTGYLLTFFIVFGILGLALITMAYLPRG